jgi:DNA topoisomerase-1
MYRDIKKLSPLSTTITPVEGQKWSLLIHNGVLFPPPYEPLPKSVKILLKGVPISLDNKNTNNPFNVSAEEAAVFFATMIERDVRLSEKNTKRKKYTEDKTFINNFWSDWKVILGKTSPIKHIRDVDFTPLQEYIAMQSDRKKITKKGLSKEEKQNEKAEKEALKELYGYAIVDYMVQPPSLYLGHGNHPLRGKIKKRIQPSDITLNISPKYIPKCTNNGTPCVWGEIVNNHDVTWIATYRNPITEDPNYVWLKREESHFVHADDLAKFDKARNLSANIKQVRKKYTEDLTSSDSTTRQLATAVYLLDVLAIRPATDKDESKESDTLGLTTLKCGNIKYGSDNNVTIDFTGKSSIQFTKKFKVDEVVYKNLYKLCKDGDKTNKIFPNITATTLNGYLKTILPDLTAKVFRTYKAGKTLEKELEKTIPDIDDPVHRKKIMFDKANIAVALALNHKNMTVSDAKVDKLKEKLKELKGELKEASTEKKKASIEKKIETAETKLQEAGENISLTTSKQNYIDPRIVVAWCKKHDVPIEKIYNKNILKKFVWGMDTRSDWKF